MTDTPDLLHFAQAEAVSQRTDKLALMVPRDLPTEVTLSAESRQRLATVLRDFLSALEIGDPSERATALDRLVTKQAAHTGTMAEVGETDIPAKTAEVKDFDNYFNVIRVDDNMPGETLLHGLLQTAASVLRLAARAPDLPRDQIDRQIAGFAAYAHLLGRICKLEEHL